MAATHFSGPVVSANGFIGGNSDTFNIEVDPDTGDATITLDGTTLIIQNLPTADPHVAGQIYAATGVLTVSAG